MSPQEKKVITSVVNEDQSSSASIDEQVPQLKGWRKFWERICIPGRQYDIKSTAKMQLEYLIEESDQETPEEKVKQVNILSTILKPKATRGGRFFDAVTDLAGSRFILGLTFLIIAAWVVAGIILGAPDNWQIWMQDGGSIQAYISDTLLMRQQQNNVQDNLTLIAQLKSRLLTYMRLLLDVENYPHKSADEDVQKEIDNAVKKAKEKTGDPVKLPELNWFDRVATKVAIVVGSIYACVVFWIGIFIWLGFGKKLGYGDVWQLYINTAVAVQITTVSMFLQNVRKRHNTYISKCLNMTLNVDSQLEAEVRQFTGDEHPNTEVVIPALKGSKGNRVIEYYACIIGTGIGVFISVCVFIVWLAIGDICSWNDNWWLIIGTYTGLVGFIDGFTLRNVYFRHYGYLEEQFEILQGKEKEFFDGLNIDMGDTYEVPKNNSITYKISSKLGYICATTTAVTCSVIAVLVLIGISSSFNWNVTGQLIANSPTMIIEGFLLMVLLDAHNYMLMKLRFHIQSILLRKVSLLAYVRSFKN